jgi:sterol desaturase/sphingolipid hydroxylase (fatty acid hydroxylase superfamily)
MSMPTTSSLFITLSIFTWERWIENLIIYTLTCSIIDILVRINTTTSTILSKRKYSKTFPTQDFMIEEALRGIRSVMIGTLYETCCFWLAHQYPNNKIQVNVVKRSNGDDDDLTWPMLIFAIVFIVIGNELHFYWTHRMLHAIDTLYKNVHSIHHLSKNMNVWSGQSFHPLEATIFFSSFLLLPMFSFITGCHIPYYLSRSMMIGLVISPGLIHQAHDFFGDVDPTSHVPKYDPYFLPSPFAHYLHHQRVIFNFGGFRITDYIFGTEEPDDVRSEMMKMEQQQE